MMKDKRPLPDDKVVLNRRRCRPLVESTDGTVNHYLHIMYKGDRDDSEVIQKLLHLWASPALTALFSCSNFRCDEELDVCCKERCIFWSPCTSSNETGLEQFLEAFVCKVALSYLHFWVYMYSPFCDNMCLKYCCYFSVSELPMTPVEFIQCVK